MTGDAECGETEDPNGAPGAEAGRDACGLGRQQRHDGDSSRAS